jgi:hypothetical protein
MYTARVPVVVIVLSLQADERARECGVVVDSFPRRSLGVN